MVTLANNICVTRRIVLHWSGVKIRISSYLVFRVLHCLTPSMQTFWPLVGFNHQQLYDVVDVRKISAEHDERELGKSKE